MFSDPIDKDDVEREALESVQERLASSNSRRQAMGMREPAALQCGGYSGVWNMDEIR